MILSIMQNFGGVQCGSVCLPTVLPIFPKQQGNGVIE